jgi:hypothetical protein
MQANSRTVYEATASQGLNPTVQIDTDDLSPPAYADIVASGEKVLQIAPADANIAVALPDCCFVLLLSDEPIDVRLLTGETVLSDIREIKIGGTDETVIAYPAGSLRLSGNGATTATVRVVWLETV